MKTVQPAGDSGNVRGFWDSKRVFVTGATGLVGTWLVDHLVRSGAHVVAYVRNRGGDRDFFRRGQGECVAVVHGELENYAGIERGLVEHEIDTVFHLAAQSIVEAGWRNPLGTFEANIRGTYNVLEACRVQARTVRRVVVASSDKFYGSSGRLPCDETMPPAGRFPYEVSKACADLIARSYFHTYELPVVVARCGNIYGGGDLNWSRIVPGTIRSLHRGEPAIIRSDGTCMRDYIYVEDAVRAFVTMAEALDQPRVAGEAFNFGPGRPYRVREVVDSLRRLMNREDLEPVVLSESRAETHDPFPDSAGAERVPGWKPRYTLEQGLEESVAWYRAFFARAA